MEEKITVYYLPTLNLPFFIQIDRDWNKQFS